MENEEYIYNAEDLLRAADMADEDRDERNALHLAAIAYALVAIAKELRARNQADHA